MAASFIGTRNAFFRFMACTSALVDLALLQQELGCELDPRVRRLSSFLNCETVLG